MTEPKSISAQEMRAACAAGKKFHVLDVRTNLEIADKCLKQEFTHMPLDRLDPANVDKDTPVYVLCKAGVRARKAAEALCAAGHCDVTVIEGGIDALEQCGIPLKRGDVISLERQVRISAGILVLLGVLLGASFSGWFYILSGFVGAGLIFAGVTDRCGMALLLARAPWNNK